MTAGIRPFAAAVSAVALGISAHLLAQAPVAVRQTAYVKASNADAGDHFACGGALDGHAGGGLALSGDGTTMAVGAPHESSSARGVGGSQTNNDLYSSGAVYVYTRSGTGWTQQAYLKAATPGQSDHFGYVVALSRDGNTLAVSAFWESGGSRGVNGNQADDSIPQSGAVYIFTRANGRWAQQAYLKASNAGEAGEGDNFGDGDQFGFSVTLSDDGNTVAVGAVAEDSNATGINGNQADNSAQSAGAVYVFARTGTAWAQQAYVKPSNTRGGHQFGYAVSLSADGSTLAVGSYDEGGGARVVDGPQEQTRNGSGAVYIFARTGATWAQRNYLKASNAEQGDSFGVSVVLSDDGATLLAGALDSDCLIPGIVHGPTEVCNNERAQDNSSGYAYVFVRSGATWAQQAFITSSNIGRTDWFGARLALSGDGNTAVIGAALEDSAAQGIDGRQNDDSAIEAGAVYYFTRSGTTWTQRAYVKGSNTQAFDEFGSSVAVSADGRTFAVGARGEDSGARAINGNQNDNSADEAGAVYVFQAAGGAAAASF
jgi:hypothetical protein